MPDCETTIPPFRWAQPLCFKGVAGVSNPNPTGPVNNFLAAGLDVNGDGILEPELHDAKV
jgi:hypothetical protein